MIFIFWGTNELAREDAVRERLATHVGASVIKITNETYQQGLLSQCSGQQSLFGGDMVVVCSFATIPVGFLEEYQALASSIAEATMPLYLVLTAMNAAEKKVLTPHAREVLLFERKETLDQFNNFALADAFLARDRRRLWLLLQAARRASVPAEEIIGVLWWQIKLVRLAAQTATAAEAGVKEYPYKKAKQALRSFPLPEVEQSARRLLTLYHDARRGRVDLDLALESWVLTQ